jgi:hypothetical protein
MNMLQGRYFSIIPINTVVPPCFPETGSFHMPGTLFVAGRQFPLAKGDQHCL